MPIALMMLLIGIGLSAGLCMIVRILKLNSDKWLAISLAPAAIGLVIGLVIMLFGFAQVQSEQARKVEFWSQYYQLTGKPFEVKADTTGINSCHGLLLSMMESDFKIKVFGKTLEKPSDLMAACRFDANPLVTFWK